LSGKTSMAVELDDILARVRVRSPHDCQEHFINPLSQGGINRVPVQQPVVLRIP
jgi:hypothetical protein